MYREGHISREKKIKRKKKRKKNTHTQTVRLANTMEQIHNTDLNKIIAHIEIHSTKMCKANVEIETERQNSWNII